VKPSSFLQREIFDVKRSISDSPLIPDKVYFRIGEVSNLVGVDTHVLRYWETEFAFVKPFRGKSKQRLYRRQDVESLLRIKGLLHDEGYTISGARKFLKSQSHNKLIKPENTLALKQTGNNDPLLRLIKKELRDILTQVSRAKNEICK
jgi:DNA-binding transcriptional MerR regulator